MPLGNLDYLLDVNSFLKEIANTVLETEKTRCDSLTVEIQSLSRKPSKRLSITTGGSMMVANDWDKMSLNGDGGYFTEAEILDSVGSMLNNSEMSLLDIHLDEEEIPVKLTTSSPPQSANDNNIKDESNPELDALENENPITETILGKKINESSNEEITYSEIKYSHEYEENYIEIKLTREENNSKSNYVSELMINVDSENNATLQRKSQRQVENLNVILEKPSGDTRPESKSDSSQTPNWFAKPSERAEINVELKKRPPTNLSTCACTEKTNISVHEIHKCIFITPSDDSILGGKGGKAHTASKSSPSLHNSYNLMPSEVRYFSSPHKCGAGDSEKMNQIRSASTQTCCHWPQYNFTLKESAAGPDEATILDDTIVPDEDISMVTEEPPRIHSTNKPKTEKHKPAVMSSNKSKSMIAVKEKPSGDRLKKVEQPRSIGSKVPANSKTKTSLPSARGKLQKMLPTVKANRKCSPVSQEATEADEVTLEHDDDTVQDATGNDELYNDINDDDSVDEIEEEEVEQEKPVPLKPSRSKIPSRTVKKSGRPPSRTLVRTSSLASVASIPRSRGADKSNVNLDKQNKRKSAKQNVQNKRNVESHVQQQQQPLSKKQSKSKRKTIPSSHKQSQQNVRLRSPPSNSVTGSVSQDDHDQSMEQPMSEIHRLLESLNIQLQGGQPPSIIKRLTDTEALSQDEQSPSIASTIAKPSRQSHHGDTFWEDPLKISSSNSKLNRQHPRQFTPCIEKVSELSSIKGVNPELEAVCKNMHITTDKKPAVAVQGNKTRANKKVDLITSMQKTSESSKGRSGIQNRRRATERTPATTHMAPVVSEVEARFPELKQVRFCDLLRYDDIVKSHQSSTDRRLKSVSAKTGCKIAVDGPFRVFDPAATCMAMRSKVSYRCYIGSSSKDKLEKCINYLKETFPNTAFRLKV